MPRNLGSISYAYCHISRPPAPRILQGHRHDSAALHTAQAAAGLAALQSLRKYLAERGESVLLEYLPSSPNLSSV